jgi:pimeloyl-ACP methyl ester carboxylesterase
MIAPDLRGFGPAADISIGESVPTIADFAEDIDALLEALGIAEGVIGGLSMGGYVTFELCRKSPERFTGMVLADTRAQADTTEGRDARRKMIELVESRGSTAVADQMLPKLLGTTSHATRPEVVASVRHMIESAPAAAIAHAVQAMLGRPDSTPDLARMSWPMLVLVGTEDAITPVGDAEAMCHGLVRSRLVVLPEAGHLSNLEAPDAFSKALGDFLLSSM